jgi:membrane-associated phospholipid phosphatase
VASRRETHAPIDRWTFVYTLLASAIVLWRVPDRRGLVALAVHGALAGLAALMPWARRAGTGGRWLGDWYPLLMLLPVYTAIGLVNRADGLAYDAVVQGWETAVFATQPAHDWIRAQASAWLAWLLHAGYLAYYPIIVGAPLALWLSGRADGMRRALESLMAAFFVCYLVFLVFPVAGPRYAFALADNEATRTVIVRGTQWLLDTFAAWGTAFPSSHVAACLAVTGAAMREWRALGRMLVIPAMLLVLGAVYGQFHYAVDVLAGAAVAAAVVVALRVRGGRLAGGAR